MNARDPFALAGVDELVELGAQKAAIMAQLDALPDDAAAAAELLVDRLIEIEDRIAAAVPISVAGAVVQLGRLAEHARDFEWGDVAEQIAGNLADGLVRLARRALPVAVVAALLAAFASASLAVEDHCREFATDLQRQVAGELIRASGYDCERVNSMCPYVFSEGFHVYCNAYRYRFELENHGGRWSVKAD